MSQTCTCNGTNENCMYCYGTGSREKRPAVPPTAQRPPKVVVSRPCPVCGVSVARVERHLKKVHGARRVILVQEGTDPVTLPKRTPPLLAIKPEPKAPRRQSSPIPTM